MNVDIVPLDLRNMFVLHVVVLLYILCKMFANEEREASENRNSDSNSGVSFLCRVMLHKEKDMIPESSNDNLLQVNNQSNTRHKIT